MIASRRNQFGKIAGVIRNSLKNVNGVTYGEFYYTVDGDFDEFEIRKLLEDFRSKLQHMEIKDFFELEECVDSFLIQIRDMWTAENNGKSIVN